jgi:hypothetical protein
MKYRKRAKDIHWLRVTLLDVTRNSIELAILVDPFCAKMPSSDIADLVPVVHFFMRYPYPEVSLSLDPCMLIIMMIGISFMLLVDSGFYLQSLKKLCQCILQLTNVLP